MTRLELAQQIVKALHPEYSPDFRDMEVRRLVTKNKAALRRMYAYALREQGKRINAYFGGNNNNHNGGLSSD